MANRKARLINAATERCLADHGIVDYTLEMTAGNHQRVTFMVGGASGKRKGVVTYPSTASDHRAVKNHVAFLRREIKRLRSGAAVVLGNGEEVPVGTAGTTIINDGRPT